MLAAVVTGAHNQVRIRRGTVLALAAIAIFSTGTVGTPAIR